MTVASTAIDLSQVLTPLLQLLGLILTALVGWAVQRLISWLNLKVSASQTAAFNDAIQKSMTYGLSSINQLIVDHGWDHPQVKSTAIAAALAYATSRFPDAIKNAGIDLKNPAIVQTYVTAALDRSFPATAKTVSDSPVTPPVPPAIKETTS